MTTTDPEIVDVPQLAVQWARIRGRLQAEVGDVEYRTWLRQMSLAGLDGDEITVTLPTRFLRDWVSTRYGDRLSALWQAENPAIRRVDIRVGGASLQPSAETQAAPREEMPRRDGLMRPDGSAQGGAHGSTQGSAAPTVAPQTTTWSDDRAEARSDLAAPLDPRF